ncbi:Sulfate/thiosulfate import ATP-binding protein CysA [Anatilimnocola aggregata]|uniref:Sulfate/thiosulfate import ATP-binding protein CysA n=1 Tax=Anatilimnocola aggregata TaxID=2528021 RepID=A0A517YD00_9BACT|nr:ABC transporter ATP-binding protein [Anatilimnocola aggregata]QDU28114.1 Sulfate/thiosulfate import ATP-binding protein CysA [Anatilimnocola aggregata]
MIELANLALRAGTFTLQNVNLVVPQGCYGVLMGGTGRGKTSLLEVICGLKPVAAGRVLLDDHDVTHWKPADRGVGYVPQDLALFPTISVRGHLEFALQLRRWSRAAIRERVTKLAGLLGIEPLLDRSVQHLSGGEAQRVAIGRAISFEPRVLLMDEPFNALDEKTRDRLCALLRSIHTEIGLTTLHVTHSRAEARQVADKLFVLDSGHLQERPLADLDNLTPEPVGTLNR